jgi:dTDP-glucose 4,6-dehydratase
MNTKIVYVTGCLGFIGSYVTEACLKKGWYVRGIDKITYAANPKLLTEFYKCQNFVFEEKDINSIDFMYDCDYIINTAAETHVDNSIVKSDDFVYSNINGVHHLLEMIRNIKHFKMPTLIHFSTDEVYGDITEGRHVESDILRPSNPYSATKAAADMLILAWARTYEVPYIIVRPTNNYGIGQYVEKLIPKACKFLELGRKIPLHNEGKPVRTWLHAADTARAIITLIEFGVRDSIYNISGGFELSNIEVCKKILEIYYDIQFIGTKAGYEYFDFTSDRRGQDIRYSLDDSKIQQLGWKSIENFDESLKKIVNYHKENYIW